MGPLHLRARGTVWLGGALGLRLDPGSRSAYSGLVLRFPNPGSSLASFVAAFQVLHGSLGGRTSFGLDDMSRALVRAGLAASSGQIGEEALLRSTRDDRSRDPLYNQSKMYSEVFRMLGWMTPLADDKLRFRLTALGAHIGRDGSAADALIGESLLGIAFPNSHVSSKSDSILRPFAAMLRTALALGGEIARDEMILGPLSMPTDRDPKLFKAMLKGIDGLRTSSSIKEALEELAEDNDVQVNSFQNYTRFPIGSMRDVGWTTPTRSGKTSTNRLTDEGVSVAKWVEQAHDVRAADLDGLSKDVRNGIARTAYYAMLERAGYDLTPVENERGEAWGRCKAALEKLGVREPKMLLFSPCQELSGSELVETLLAFESADEADNKPAAAPAAGGASKSKTQPKVMLELLDAPAVAEATDDVVDRVAAKIKKLDKARTKPEQIVDALMEDHAEDDKGEFYPLVAGLFRILGYDCNVTRAGVNQERADAMIRHKVESVPIEIKSPAEERRIGVKAIEQAVENKVILLSRKYAPTLRETSSLVVGFSAPNDRADVTELIADVHATFGLSVGVLDLRSLLRLVVSKVVRGKAPEEKAILRLRGIADVAAL